MTALHALFVRRVREEMTARGLNPNRLQDYGIRQRTLADILNGADPRLSTIYAAATALGMKGADLLREGPEKRVIKLAEFQENPTILPPQHASHAPDRKKRRR